MKVLLDTNIVIHREASHVVLEDIGTLFNWLERIHAVKCVHPITIDEIKRHQDKRVVESMEIKLKSYQILKTAAPLDARVQTIIQTIDRDENDKNDSLILNEVVCNRVDWFITEDRAIHEKASQVSVSDRVFTIDAFLEKVAAENPELVPFQLIFPKNR